MKKIIFSQEQINKARELYGQGLSLDKIGKEFNVSRTVITRLFKENEIIIKKDNHKYKGNYDIFEIIDTSEKAYWLGFLAADGCNYRREQNATILINLNQKDRIQLEKFLQFCNCDSQIIDYIATDGYSNNTPMSKIQIYSSKMSDDLTKLGVPPRKSLILQPPKIEKKYFLPYILGYFDGDGSISKASQYNNYTISIQGTKEILEWINSILQISHKLEQRKETNKNSYYIRCGGTNKPYQILKQLYSSCDIHLDRKYKIYKDLETVVLNRNIQ